MTKFVVTQTNFERGGARYCGMHVMAVRDTLESAKKFVEDHVQMSRDMMDWEDQPVKWTKLPEYDQWTTVDFEACSDFSQFQIDPVSDVR